jgi:hypothetical protein
MPYPKIAEEALAAWRDADRRLAELTPDTPEWEECRLERDDARDRYDAAVEAARREHLPPPPPFDKANEA